MGAAAGAALTFDTALAAVLGAARVIGYNHLRGNSRCSARWLLYAVLAPGLVLGALLPLTYAVLVFVAPPAGAMALVGAASAATLVTATYLATQSRPYRAAFSAVTIVLLGLGGYWVVVVTAAWQRGAVWI